MTAKPKVLFVGGSLNQTTQLHAVAKGLQSDADCFFSPYYGTGIFGWAARRRMLDRTIMGFGAFYENSLSYLREHGLSIDEQGRKNKYDLVVTGSDLFIQDNIRDKPIVLVQEGMTDEENFLYPIMKNLGLPMCMTGNTAGTGLSDAYVKFCIASEGYKAKFEEKGVKPWKMVVTGIPNYDNAQVFTNTSFPHRQFVLCATTDMRETLKFENRRATIEHAVSIAAGRQLIFKLHPNEHLERAKSEIGRWAPGALVYQNDANVHEMIACCDVLITQFSTVVYTGLALGKEVYSEFDLRELKALTPLQNGGTSGARIADVCREVIREARAEARSSAGLRSGSSQSRAFGAGA